MSTFVSPAVSLGRGPGAAAVTVAFLVLAFALALLAEGYRATLARGEADQAAFRGPARRRRARGPAAARTGARRGAAQALWEARWWRRSRPCPPRARRRRAGRGRLGRHRAGPARIRRRSAARLAELLGRRVAGDARGRHRASSTRSRSPGSGCPRTTSRSRQAPARSRWSPRSSPPGTVPPRRAGPARRAMPPESCTRPSRPSYVTARSSRSSSYRHACRNVEPTRARRSIGVLRLSGLPLAGWVGEGGVRVPCRARRRPAQLPHHAGAHRRGCAHPRPTDEEPPAVLATPRLAALAGGVGGILPLRIAGASVPVRVAEVVERFPGSTGESVIGDAGALEVAINVEAPGAARTSEVWLEVPSGHDEAVAAALARPPFRALESISRRELEAGARNDPLGHGTLFALGAAALVALLLAAVGLALTVRSDLRDDRGELYDLESQGAGPALLRRVVRARALVVALAGLAGGALAGALLALLVTRVVSVTARATAPEPPLATTFAAGVVASGAVAYLVLAVAPRRARHPWCVPRRARPAAWRGDGMTRVVDAHELFCVYPSPQGGVAALQGLTLAVEQGEICIVLGPSGSGKTTLMRVLAGLERPSSGSLTVAGLELGSPARPAARALPVGDARLRGPALLAGSRRRSSTAEELVAVPLGLAGVGPSATARSCARAARARRPAGASERPSGRALRRGAAADRTLCRARPPAAAADRRRAHRRARPRDAQRTSTGCSPSSRASSGATALVVSHDPNSAEIADRVVHIRDGRVSEEEGRRRTGRRRRARRLAADPGGDVACRRNRRPRAGGVARRRRRAPGPSRGRRRSQSSPAPWSGEQRGRTSRLAA